MDSDRMDALLERAKWGRISPSELADVVAEVERATENDNPDLYTLLHILGRASDAERHADVVARFIDYHEDPMVAGLALQILGQWWGRAEEWLPVLRRSVEGQEWDIDNEVQLVACSVSGEYLRDRSDPALLRALVTVAENQAVDSVVRKGARDKVARALGYSHREILGMDSGLPAFDRVRRAAEERISAESRG